MLNTRYSGEYIRFGNDENNLYRIVSHEIEGLTKITSAEPLKSGGSFIKSAFDRNSNVNYSNTNTIGTFLNGEYLTSYIDSSYSEMIEESTTWYLGTVRRGTSYKLAKYTDTSMSGYAPSTESKVGLLRVGELMAGQFDRSDNNTNYWILTPGNSSRVYVMAPVTNAAYIHYLTNSNAIRPSLNLKSNVVITGGDGTKDRPFVLSVQ